MRRIASRAVSAMWNTRAVVVLQKIKSLDPLRLETHWLHISNPLCNYFTTYHYYLHCTGYYITVHGVEQLVALVLNKHTSLLQSSESSEGTGPLGLPLHVNQEPRLRL